MRLTGLLALLLFVLIIFYAAPAASYAQTVSAPTPQANNTESQSLAFQMERMHQVRPGVNEYEIVAAQPLLEHSGDLMLRESPAQADLDDFTCLTMRTYIMKRDDKDSDATHLVRKVKCTPARKFNFKTADIRNEDQNSQPAKK
jgi:hypothetical protein